MAGFWSKAGKAAGITLTAAAAIYSVYEAYQSGAKAGGTTLGIASAGGRAIVDLVRNDLARVATPGSVSADLRLVPAGTQNLSNLAVRGMSASGQWLAPGQTNQGSGPVSRWFGDPNAAVAPIPTTSQWTLLIMALALGATAVRQRRAKLENSQEGNRS